MQEAIDTLSSMQGQFEAQLTEKQDERITLLIQMEDLDAAIAVLSEQARAMQQALAAVRKAAGEAEKIIAQCPDERPDREAVVEETEVPATPPEKADAEQAAQVTPVAEAKTAPKKSGPALSRDEKQLLRFVADQCELFDKPWLRMSDRTIAQQARLPEGTLTALLEALMGAGLLIVRKTAAANGKGVVNHVELTDDGLTLSGRSDG